MSRPFRRARGGAVAGTLHPAEADLLRSLVSQLLDLLDAEAGPGGPGAAVQAGDAGDALDPLAAVVGLEASAERPDDPVLLRLFPDAYRDDEAAAGDFRRFTERGLREGKVRNARTVLDCLDAGIADRPDRLTMSIDHDQAMAWMRTLTDLRLALGTRLGVEQDDEDRWAELPEDDPLTYVHDVYEWLGWLQENIVRAVAGT